MRLLRLMMLFLLVFVISLKAQEVKEAEKSAADVQSQEPLEDQNKPVEITENKDGNKTKPIIVKGRRGKRIDKASTTTEVTAEDIEARSDKLLKDVLHQVPSIQIATERKGTTKFKMRGYDMSKIAILIDGIPVIDAYSDSMDIDNIGLLDISEIVVSRGTCSALYGARGTVGSINLIKKEPIELYANISAEYGEHGNYIASVSQGAPIGNFFYYISGSYDKLRGYTISGKLDRKKREEWLLKISRYDLYGRTLNNIYDNPLSSAADDYLNDKGLWDHTEHEKYKVSGKAGYHITPNLEAGVSSFYNHTKMENSVYTSDLKDMYTYDVNNNPYWQAQDNDKVLGNMSNRWPEYYDYAIAPYVNYEHGKFKFKGNLYFYEQSSTYAAYSDPKETSYAHQHDTTTMVWSIWTSQTYGFNMYPSYLLFPWNRLNFALSYYTANHKEEEKAYNDASTETIKNYGRGKYKTLYIEADYLTLAVEDEMRIIRDIELTLGVSYDAQDITKFRKKHGTDGSTEMDDKRQAEDNSMIWGTNDSFNPVAGIVYEPVKDFLKLRAAASHKTSFPGLNAYTKTKNYYKESTEGEGKDIRIKPEKSFNENTGFEFSFFDKQLSWGTDYFYSKFEDKIERIFIMREGDNIYRNAGTVVIHGAESVLTSKSKNVLDIADVDISLTYTYIFARKQSDVENSFVNKGDKPEKLPEHKFTFDFRTRFKTDTSLIIFGYLEYNQILYTMASRPNAGADFSTKYYYAQKIHNPVMIDVKLSQKIYYDYEVYVMCRNILDDYLADPFNPGPGRMWYGGFKANF
ncbi:MAG: TonB-dependent receptor plug domain-containing protein [Spirochaetota bacterium]